MADRDVVQTRVCTKCEMHQPLSMFTRRAALKSGYRSQCKACDARERAAYYQTAAGKAKADAWGKKNPESRAATYRRWVEKNPEENLARYARYREKNPDRVAASRERGREKKNERARIYAKANAAKVLAHVRARQCAKIQRTPIWLSPEQKSLMASLYSEASRITRETGVPHEVDHIIPLRGKAVSGLHVPWNLQVLPRSMNRKKGRRFEGAAGPRIDRHAVRQGCDLRQDQRVQVGEASLQASA